MLTLLVNLAYVLMLFAFVTTNMLRLRLLLIAAQILLGAYTFANGLRLLPAWNVVFVFINAYMVLKILRERRALELPADLQRLHDAHFAALSAREFLRFWNMGRRERLQDAELTTAGTHPEWLYFLLSGTVLVTREGALVRELPSGYFVAEMSLLTGQPANADVRASGPVEVMRWARTELQQIRQRNIGLWTKMQAVLGRDLVEKIHLGELHHKGTA